ncbi:beta-ketoacyl synthase N-terminal-like domain-containing protein [Streptomyces cyaneofuscatus]
MTENFVKTSGQDVVAVVGLSCRVPGASSSEAYWNLLAAGGEAVGEIPADRAVHVGARVGQGRTGRWGHGLRRCLLRGVATRSRGNGSPAATDAGTGVGSPRACGSRPVGGAW